MVTSVVPVTASMLDVGPVEAKNEGGMVVKGGGGMTMVDELDKLFTVDGSAQPQKTSNSLWIRSDLLVFCGKADRCRACKHAEFSLR